MAGRYAVLAALFLAAGVAAADDSARATLGGNEFLAGGQVELDQRVRRNAYVSGGVVTVSGPVGRDLFAAGGEVRLEGEVDGDARIAGGNLGIASRARIGGDAFAAGGVIAVDGGVAGDLRAFGERIVVNGRVDGDVQLTGESLRIGPDARVGGRVYYRSGDEIVLEPGAQVARGVERVASDRAWRRIAHGAGIAGGIAISIGMVLIGAVLVLGAPRFSREAAAAIRARTWETLGLGLAMLVGVPIAILMLAITIVGIPLAMLLAFAYGALLLVGYLTGAIFVGDLALGRIDATKLDSVWWRLLFMLLAIIAVALVKEVPVAGSLAVAALFLAGLGAFTLRSWQGFRNDPATVTR